MMTEKEHENEEAKPREETGIDEDMLEMSDFISQMSDIDGYVFLENAEFAMELEEVSLDMPMQLDVNVSDDGWVELGGSPPLYYVETTVMPVFHQIKIRMESDVKNQ